MPEKPRVRFAPSPTGELHVGNARTALFNWLFARHYEGTFILRIEDTDRERTSERFEDAIINELKWLSIDWDEGPEKDGDFGPYHQFERLDIYRDYLHKLIEKERVYPCYCTDEELEEERAKLIAMRRMPRYMGRCRNLSATQRKAFEKKGRKPAYRFNVGKEIIEFKDLIRGNMRFDSETIGDFIIVRSNGIPAYNFAAVIDDYLMKVSHVIRGEDHLSNTALQLLIYRSLEFTPPFFAHHSLILGKDRSKLSKRHGSVTVREFREKGFLSEAFLNYMSLLGSSFSGGKEVCPMDEVIRDFTLERAGKSGAIFDEQKLQWMNGIYMRKYDPEKLVGLLKPFIVKAGYAYESLDKAWLAQIVESLRDNMTLLSDVGDHIDMFFDDRFELSHDARSFLADDSAMKVLHLVRETLERSKGDLKSVYDDVISTVRGETGLKGRKLFMPIRAAVTGKLTGPELDKIFAILGRESMLKRVDTAIQNVELRSET